MITTVPLSWWQREYFSSDFQIAFLQAMQLRIQAGERVGRALSTVICAEPNAAKRRDMAGALQALEQGDAVSVAMGKLGFFDSTVLSILRAGERSGMGEAIRSAARHLSLKQAWFRQHALVIFLLANEMFSAVMAPVLLITEGLPWIRRHIAEPSAPAALLAYQRDILTAERLTYALIVLNVVLITMGAVYLLRLRRSAVPNRMLMFFSEGAMGVSFTQACAMLAAGVTIEAVARDLALQAPGLARYYWKRVHLQLEQAIEPALALLQPGLSEAERSLLASHANAQQLAKIFDALSQTREFRAKRARDILLLGATFLTVAYILMTLGVAVWIYMTYDATLSAGLEALGSGF
jgi:type II secretory pathway component PulF